MAADKVEEKPKAVVKPKVEKKVEKGPEDPKGDRRIIATHPSRNKALVGIGKEEFKVVRHMKRTTGQWFLAVDGQKSITEEDWLKGKANLGLKA